MSGPNHNKPGGKSGQRSRKRDQQRSEKPQQQKPDQLLSQKPDQLQPEPLASLKPEPLPSQRPEQLPSQKPEPRIEAAIAAANTPSIDFQTIAAAYGDYTKKSFEETKAFVEKLSGVRSLGNAVEIQTEYAKQVYETFVTESQKIRELYRGLAKQAFGPFEGFVANMTQAPR